jgi:hypothetical protein
VATQVSLKVSQGPAFVELELESAPNPDGRRASEAARKQRLKIVLWKQCGQHALPRGRDVDVCLP